MSDPASPLAVNASPLVDSHNLRSAFEKWALIAFLSVVVMVCLIAFIAALWPPAKPHEQDWAQSIVARIVQLKDTFSDMLFALGGSVGMSLARGHFDVRALLGMNKDTA